MSTSLSNTWETKATFQYWYQPRRLYGRHLSPITWCFSLDLRISLKLTIRIWKTVFFYGVIIKAKMGCWKLYIFFIHCLREATVGGKTGWVWTLSIWPWPHPPPLYWWTTLRNFFSWPYFKQTEWLQKIGFVPPLLFLGKCQYSNREKVQQQFWI